MSRLARLALLPILAALALPAAAAATALPGANGKIVFASGRAASDVPSPADDNNARLWVADGPTGTPVQVTTEGPNTQDRHPNWSPDHTKIVYAAGKAFTGPFAIKIKDLVTGGESTFVDAAAAQDRPTWSPDGTKIAYGSGGSIWVKAVAPGSTPVQITMGVDDQRPVWSPDGNTLYFNRGPALNRDLYKVTPVVAAPGGTVTGVLVASGATNDDWQPAVSPDGTRLCFLRGPQSDGADLWTVNVNGTEATPFATTGPGAGTGELNCVWSPDGQSILYTLGAFGLGDLAMRDKNGNNFQTLTSLSVASHFDGNADWATNLSPTCTAPTKNIGVNQFTTVQLSCVDPDFGFGADPPTPTPIGSDGLTITALPAHGNIGAIHDDGSIVYTPNKNFRGTDTFAYTGNDGASDSKSAVVTIHVGTGPGGVVDRKAPLVSRVKLSARRFKRGGRLPSIAKIRTGTTISFKVSEDSRVTLGFQRPSKGRRVGRRCAKVTPRNRSRRSCTRFRSAGKIKSFSAKAGVHRVRFQGRLSRSRRLGLGRYRVVITAVDAAGNRSTHTGPSFTIIAG